MSGGAMPGGWGASSSSRSTRWGSRSVGSGLIGVSEDGADELAAAALLAALCGEGEELLGARCDRLAAALAAEQRLPCVGVAEERDGRVHDLFIGWPGPPRRVEERVADIERPEAERGQDAQRRHCSAAGCLPDAIARQASSEGGDAHRAAPE